MRENLLASALAMAIISGNANATDAIRMQAVMAVKSLRDLPESVCTMLKLRRPASAKFANRKAAARVSIGIDICC